MFVKLVGYEELLLLVKGSLKILKLSCSFLFQFFG